MPKWIYSVEYEGVVNVGPYIRMNLVVCGRAGFLAAKRQIRRSVY